MSPRKSSPAKSRVRKAPAKTTVSGPSRPAAPPAADNLARKMADTEKLSASIPFNRNKPDEFGGAEASEGFSEKPDNPDVGASTLSESNASEKTGSGGPPIGTNKLIAPLDRVRVDSSEQTLTTNQGVPVADNQNSLKAGLRGPTLLEDFILREKITHFDHERIPERIVHARGSAAHGYFECYKPMIQA
jgi:catalase